MLEADWNTDALDLRERQDFDHEIESLAWQYKHGVKLPSGMDTEQAEEYLSVARDYDVDIHKPWYYKEWGSSRYDGAFNTDKVIEYMKDWINLHGPEMLLRDIASKQILKSDLVDILFGDEGFDLLDFLKDEGFQEWK